MYEKYFQNQLLLGTINFQIVDFYQSVWYKLGSTVVLTLSRYRALPLCRAFCYLAKSRTDTLSFPKSPQQPSAPSQSPLPAVSLLVPFAVYPLRQSLFTVCRVWRRIGKRCTKSSSPSRSSSTPYRRRSASRGWKRRWSSWNTTSASSRSTRSSTSLTSERCHGVEEETEGQTLTDITPTHSSQRGLWRE